MDKAQALFPLKPAPPTAKPQDHEAIQTWDTHPPRLGLKESILDQTSVPEYFPHELQGLPGLRLPDGGVFIARQGAQVLSWRAADGRERLYLSPMTGGMTRGAGAPGPAIRGGIPVCFPQFSDRGSIVKHGFARNLPWSLYAPGQLPGPGDEVRVNQRMLRLSNDGATEKIWPHAFDAELSVDAGQDHLTVSLSVTNRGGAPWEFTAALHTYLSVSDVRNIAVAGLGNARYQDATAGNVESLQKENELRFTGEVDRVYLAPPKELLVFEDGQPPLRVSQLGFTDTVVWNPGPDKARALPDFPDEDWLRMVCIEAACAAAPVRLLPGEHWRGSQTLRVMR